MEIYKGEIYDSHQHFWLLDGSQPRFPLSVLLRKEYDQGKSVDEIGKAQFPQFYSFAGSLERWVRDYLPPDWEKEASGHNVTRTTQVEAGWGGPKTQETAFQQSLFNKHGNPCVAIGGCDLTKPNCQAELEEQQKFPIFRGIRVSAANHPDALTFAPPKLMEDENFRKGVAVLAAKNLILEIWCFSHQLPQLAKLADDFPTLTIVLNHFGTPVNIRDQKVEEEWRRNLAEVAKRRNVLVKVSGFGMGIVGIGFSRNPTAEEIVHKIRPYFRYVLEQFTLERSLFASNFPVDGALLSYRNIIDAYKILLREAAIPLDDQRKFFFSNALQLYKP